MMIHLALTTGEPAGVGPEISLKAAQDYLSSHDDVVIHLIGDESLFPNSHDRLIVEHCPLAAPVQPGILNIQNSTYVLETLDRAISSCLSGKYDAMVTAPVQKSVIAEMGIPFTGHTEYLAEKCGSSLVVMMLCGKPIFESPLLPKELRVALVTTHIPLKDVSKAISKSLLEKTIAIVDHDLRSKFNLKQPKIYVTGLNPHAGESGHLGREELEVIIPAMTAMQDKGYNLVGPFPGDTIFSPKNLMDADVILAMSHDQGLAPFKFATFGGGVNVTLGLPVIRTSVDHGTALNIAGKGIADPSSMIAALDLATKMARNTRGTSGS
jgi:4-hydroxythreonine-4-phosphate dehydrogenase